MRGAKKEVTSSLPGVRGGRVQRRVDGRQEEERLQKKEKREEERERERIGREKPVTAEGSARLSAQRGTVDSSKCIEQVLQNQHRVTFRKRRPQWKAPRAPSGPGAPSRRRRRILRTAGM